MNVLCNQILYSWSQSRFAGLAPFALYLSKIEHYCLSCNLECELCIHGSVGTCQVSQPHMRMCQTILSIISKVMQATNKAHHRKLAFVKKNLSGSKCQFGCIAYKYGVDVSLIPIQFNTENPQQSPSWERTTLDRDDVFLYHISSVKRHADVYTLRNYLQTFEHRSFALCLQISVRMVQAPTWPHYQGMTMWHD